MVYSKHLNWLDKPQFVTTPSHSEIHQCLTFIFFFRSPLDRRTYVQKQTEDKKHGAPESFICEAFKKDTTGGPRGRGFTKHWLFNLINWFPKNSKISSPKYILQKKKWVNWILSQSFRISRGKWKRWSRKVGNGLGVGRGDGETGHTHGKGFSKMHYYYYYYFWLTYW